MGTAVLCVISNLGFLCTTATSVELGTLDVPAAGVQGSVVLSGRSANRHSWGQEQRSGPVSGRQVDALCGR